MSLGTLKLLCVFDRFSISQILICSSCAMLVLHALNHAFAKIPIGGHTILACVAESTFFGLVSVSLRSVHETIVPFEVVIVGICGILIGEILFGMIKFIPVKNERSGQTKRWAIGT